MIVNMPTWQGYGQKAWAKEKLLAGGDVFNTAILYA